MYQNEQLKKKFEDAMKAAGDLASKIYKARTELGKVSTEIAAIDAERINRLAHDGDGDAQLPMLQAKRRREEDLKKIIAHLEAELRNSLKRIWENELRALAEDAHQFKLKDLQVARRQEQEASARHLDAYTKAQRAETEMLISADWPTASLNIKNGAAWVEGEAARLTGESSSAPTYTPRWL